MSDKAPGIHRGRWQRLALAAAAAALLAAIFLAYLQPGFIVDLANRIYLCF